MVAAEEEQREQQRQQPVAEERTSDTAMMLMCIIHLIENKEIIHVANVRLKEGWCFQRARLKTCLYAC